MLKLVGTLYALLIPMGPGSRRSGGFITLAWGCGYYLLKVDYNLPGFYHFHFCQFLFFIGRLLDGCMLQPGRFLKTDFKRRLKIVSTHPIPYCQSLSDEIYLLSKKR